MIVEEVFNFFKKECSIENLEYKDFKSLLEINNILLLSRTDQKYTFIEQINDYEFTNSIAYEMLWRNDKFQDLINNNENLDEIEYIQKLKEFGIYSTFKKLENPYNYYGVNGRKLIYDETIKTFFKEDWQSYLLKDVKNGLEKLINYYYVNSKIYVLQQSKYFGYGKNFVKENIIFDEYRVINDDTLKVDYILDTPHYYYINCDYSSAHWNQSSAFNRFQKISDELPLQILEKEFLNSLDISDIKFKSIQLSAEYTHPKLFFPEMQIISVPLNLGLKIKELTSLISKLKEEIEAKDNTRKLQIKEPIFLIKNENKDSERIEKIKIFKQKTIESQKKEIATAFYIYDTFKALEDIRLLLIRDNIKHKKYKKEVLYQEIGNILGKDIKKLKDYATYMKKLIDNKSYRELVTGKMTLT